MDELFKMVQKAYKKNEVPIAAVIVKNGKIIFKFHNKKNKTNNPLMHAEIICILKASKKFKSWRLNKCELYTTLEPCEMCKKVIEEARIKNVYYLCKRKTSWNSNTKYEYIESELKKEYQTILQQFFKNKRNNV